MAEFSTGSYNKLMEIIKKQQDLLILDLNTPDLKDIREYTRGKLDQLDILKSLIHRKNLVEA